MTLLDTPGHHDFSEDTLRVMSAADCAVVLLDASRGIERQTARLLEVARERRMPLPFELARRADRELAGGAARLADGRGAVAEKCDFRVASGAGGVTRRRG